MRPFLLLSSAPRTRRGRRSSGRSCAAPGWRRTSCTRSGWRPPRCPNSGWTTTPASSSAAARSRPAIRSPRSRPSSTGWSGSCGSCSIEVVVRDFPFFGACYGVGTLGVHQGGVVDRTYGEPIGPVRVSLTDAGAADPVLAGMAPEFEAFVGHKEAVRTLPRDAVLLATSASCPVQMFRVRRNLYATQFHPELDVAGLLVRVRVYQHAGYFPPDELAALVARLEPRWSPNRAGSWRTSSPATPDRRPSCRRGSACGWAAAAAAAARRRCAGVRSRVPGRHRGGRPARRPGARS